MAIAPGKIHRKKKPVQTAKPLGTELDPQFWSKNIIWMDNKSGTSYQPDKFNLLVKRGDINAKTFVEQCGNCRHKPSSCKCVKHICGYTVVVDTVTWSHLGRCQKQEHCPNCCRCVVCTKCKKLLVSKQMQGMPGFARKHITPLTCQACGACNACCACIECVNCGKAIHKQCHCEQAAKRPHHADCCDSNKIIEAHTSALHFIKRQPLFLEGDNFQHNRCRRFLSVESEILQFRGSNGKLDMRPLNYFARDTGCAIVTEGTVPNGGEICTSPASGERFTKLIHDLAGIYIKNGAEVNVRCGMHVHVDARDFHYTDIVNLLYLYNKLEVALFAMLPPWRRISRFAVPCRSALMDIAKGGNNLVEAIRDVETQSGKIVIAPKDRVRKPSIALKMASKLYGTQSLGPVKKMHKTADNQHVRYMALNLHSWVFRRTIEFRHYQGTIDEREMTLWPQLLGAIMDTAKRLPLMAPKKQPSVARLSGNPVEALLEVLQPKSWISSELVKFAEEQLNKWSPDFDTIWPILADEKESVVPFRAVSSDKRVLSFDIANRCYTYIPPKYKVWDYEWASPMNVDGRYAETIDLLAVPQRSVAWMHPIPKVKVETKQVPVPAPRATILDDAQTLWDEITRTNVNRLRTNTRQAANTIALTPPPTTPGLRTTVAAYQPEPYPEDPYFGGEEDTEE